MGRKAKEFSRGEIKRIAINYATTSCDLSASYYARLYDTSETVIYSIIKRAVVESMVSNQVVNLIANKSGMNSAQHGGERGRKKSNEKYRRLIEKRENFEFTRSEKEYFTIEYADSDQAVDMKIFAELHCMTSCLLQKTLKSAVIDSIVSDDVVDKLFHKALQHNPRWRVEKFFKMLKRERQLRRDAERSRRKELRLQRQRRNEEDEIKAMLDAYLLNPADGEKREQMEFVQMSIPNYSIPDEMAEQLASLEASAKENCNNIDETNVPTSSEEIEPDENQMNFWSQQV